MSQTIEVKAKIKKCPFCRNRAEIKEDNAYTYKGYRITCIKCHASSERIIAGAGYYSRNGFKRFTKKQAIKEALKKWNRRYTRNKKS